MQILYKTHILLNFDVNWFDKKGKDWKIIVGTKTFSRTKPFFNSLTCESGFFRRSTQFVAVGRAAFCQSIHIWKNHLQGFYIGSLKKKTTTNFVDNFLIERGFYEIAIQLTHNSNNIKIVLVYLYVVFKLVSISEQ